MERYVVEGCCLIDRDTGLTRVEAVDTPRNRRKLVRLADTFNRREKERASLEHFMRRNSAAFI